MAAVTGRCPKCGEHATITNRIHRGKMKKLCSSCHDREPKWQGRQFKPGALVRGVTK